MRDRTRLRRWWPIWPVSGFVLVALLLASITLVTGHRAAATTTVSVPAWPDYHHDAQHTGRTTAVGPSTPTIKWRVQLPIYNSAPIAWAPVVGANGDVFATTNDGTLFALSAADGSTLWSDNQTPSAMSRAASVGPNDEVYVGVGNPSPFQADYSHVDRLNNGQTQWSFGRAGYWGNYAGYGGFSAPTLFGNTLYVGDHYFHAVYALSATTGAVLWAQQLGGTLDLSSPAVSLGGNVYIGSTDGNLYALNGTNGTVLWHYLTGGAIWSSPTVGPDGTVYIGSTDGYLYALSGADGSLRWRFQTLGHIVFSSPAIGADGTVYIGSRGGDVDALNPADGSLRWQYQTSGDVDSAPAIGGDGTIYVGATVDTTAGSVGFLYALRGSDGTAIWSASLGYSVGEDSPAIGADGTIYIGGNAGAGYDLFAIGPGAIIDTTPPVISTPTSLTVDATSPAGATVTYSVTASDPDNPPSDLTLTCIPASGATIPIGITTIHCTASDPAGNTATVRFQVTVEGAAAQLSDLIALIKSFHLPSGIQTSLIAKLKAASAAIAADDTPLACMDLTDFVSSVRAQSGKTLTVAQAAQLTSDANRIQVVLAC